MTEDRELFEAWFAKENTPHTVHDFDETHIETMFIGFKAARAIDKEEIDELTENCNFLHDKNQRLDKLLHERDEQLAAALSVIEQKDAALKLLLSDYGGRYAGYGEPALAITPDLSALAEHDAKLLGEPFCYVHPMFLNRNCIGGEFSFFKPMETSVPLYLAPELRAKGGE